jgi:hypothetical protein
MIDRNTARVRRWSYVLGTSMAAVAAASASPVSAQCSPDPTPQFGITECTGIDEDGFAVTSSSTRVTIANDAEVRSAGTGAAISVSSFNSSIAVGGLIDGRAGAGIAVIAGPATTVPCDPYSGASVGTCIAGTPVLSYPSASASVTVTEGGTVTGAQALLLSRDATNSIGYVSASVTNAGLMTGTAGPAIVNAAGSNTSLSVTNLATGEIDGISGRIDNLFNAGLIDGGSDTAIAAANGSALITNSGRIVSSGTAISAVGTGTLTISNAAGATIVGDAIAINASGALTLTNAGTITGSVISTAAAGQNSVIDTRLGTIEGDLVLGAGDDTLRALYDSTTGRVSSITGTIDGGAGSDTIVIGLSSNATLGAIALPTNFELLGLELTDNAAVTLSPAFTTGVGISLSGYGSVVNQADLTTTGLAVTAGNFGLSLRFTNEADIAATLSGTNQAAVDGIGYVTNTGTIVATGGSGVKAFSSLVNDGTITATGTAALISYGTLINTGTILSTGGIGASISSGYAGSINSGTIGGATTGAVLSNASLINAGTITGSETGVELNYSGTLVNVAGATVSGGTNAIANTGLNAHVVNAGTINGTVRLASGMMFDSSDDVFVDAGGTVNGAILLGGGDDQLIVDLAADPARPLAGATGGVDAGAGYDTLRYIVNGDATANLALTGGFEGLAYELDNGAALTLTAAEPITTGIGLTGNGTVTLAGVISASDRAVIDTSIRTVGQMVYGVAGVAQDLTIVNNGSLSLTRSDPYSSSLLSAVNAGTANFTNNGAISVSSAVGLYYPAYGVFLGSVVTNAGTITLTGGGTGIGNSLAVFNAGTITDTDDAGARGVAFFTTLDNSGTILVDGNAVEAGYSSATITNSGTIASRGATAVTLGGYGSVLTNEATGTITGVTAVDITSGGLVINRGAIVGDVSGYAYSYSSTTYVADGGTVAGNLTFGAGNDTFVMTGSGTGVTGTIDGGAGNNMFGYALTDSSSVSLDVGTQFIGFGNAMVQVADANAVATVTAVDLFSGTLYVSGTGKVINAAAISGDVVTQTRYLGGVVPLTNLYTLAAFENRGTISGDISGTMADFVNSGTVKGDINLYQQDALTFANSGTIGGAVRLSYGNDRVENSGTITGDVLLDAGDDTFVQHAGATLGGVVDGGWGTDLFMVVADAEGTLDAGQITSFERLIQTGTATVDYSGAFAVDAIELEGGTLAVASGQTLATAGAVTVSGGDAGANVRNMGAIAGLVQLGAGNDSYTEGTGSTVGGVDGGAGIDLYRVALAGDRTGIGVRTGFEQLAVEGSGTLTFALDQDFQSVALSGTNFTATLGGHTLGRIDGSDAAEHVVLDGDITAVSLGAGDDSLSLATLSLAGTYAGGAGSDAFHVTAVGPVTLTGSLTGFETLSMNGDALTVAGTLGAVGDTLLLEGGAQNVILARDGTIAGGLNLGAGDDTFRVAAGGALTGSVDGGAGNNIAIIELADSATLSGALTGFERLQTEGSGALTLAGGDYSLGVVNLSGDLAVAEGASLSASTVTFGPADNRVTIAGSFAGSIDGGAGSDTIDVSGNAVFVSLAGVEALRMNAGLATVSGSATLGSIALAGGRLTGLAGSTISAPSITVAQGAVFGSAGTVNGNVTVVGTLSPGASPGTMTVNGNVSLAGTSVSVFEITPTISDKLVVNGQLAIAQGATLQIVADTSVTPGKSLELITTSGGISGSFSKVVKPASLFGFLVQDEDSITLMGQFLNDASYSAPIRSAIDYINGVLVGGNASDALLAAVPRLVTASGASDAAAFALLTPEAYAAAGQIVVEQGLELAAAGRSDAFAAHRETPGTFTFASALGSTRTLNSGANGTAHTRTTGYGFLGGLGLGSAAWSLGAFVGYLDSRQTLFTRAARTDLDGMVAGVHARWTDERIGIKATLAYGGGKATTRRALPAADTGRSHYDLTGWTADASVDYAVQLSGNWTVRPGLGVTAIRVTRDGVVEQGGSPYALTVARGRDHAVFVDGAITFKGGQSEAAKLRPYLSLGVRYQIDGRTPYALAALGGGGYGLEAAGAARSPLLATATLGADFAVNSKLTMFGALNGEAGDADNRVGARAGLRLAF